MADSYTMKRWKRHGQDRLYVATASGEDIGWLDLVNGSWSSPLADDDVDLRAWLEAHPDLIPQKSGQSVALELGSPQDGAASEQHRQRDDDSAVDLASTDLSENVPGRSLDELAKEAKAAAPIKTRLARVLGVHTQERAWRVGSRGETEVGRRLEKLPETWHVIHSIPLDANGTDVDHLVIGPGGVFTLNTKHHPDKKVWIAGDTVLVNGQKTQYVRKSRREAQTVEHRLIEACGFPISARPVLVFMGCDLTIKEPPGDVHVVGRKRVAKWLATQPDTLTADQISRVHDHARLRSTWLG